MAQRMNDDCNALWVNTFCVISQKSRLYNKTTFVIKVLLSDESFFFFFSEGHNLKCLITVFCILVSWKFDTC